MHGRLGKPLLVSFVGVRWLRTAPIQAEHPDTQSSRTAYYETVIKAVHKVRDGLDREIVRKAWRVQDDLKAAQQMDGKSRKEPGRDLRRSTLTKAQIQAFTNPDSKKQEESKRLVPVSLRFSGEGELRPLLPEAVLGKTFMAALTKILFQPRKVKKGNERLAERFVYLGPEPIDALIEAFGSGGRVDPVTGKFELGFKRAAGYATRHRLLHQLHWLMAVLWSVRRASCIPNRVGTSAMFLRRMIDLLPDNPCNPKIPKTPEDSSKIDANKSEKIEKIDQDLDPISVIKWAVGESLIVITERVLEELVKNTWNWQQAMRLLAWSSAHLGIELPTRPLLAALVRWYHRSLLLAETNNTKPKSDQESSEAQEDSAESNPQLVPSEKALYEKQRLKLVNLKSPLLWEALKTALQESTTVPLHSDDFYRLACKLQTLGKHAELNFLLERTKAVVGTLEQSWKRLKYQIKTTKPTISAIKNKKQTLPQK